MTEDVSPGELTRWLQRVEKKLDDALSDHETRLRRVERVMYIAIGLSAALGSGVGSFVGRAMGG